MTDGGDAEDAVFDDVEVGDLISFNPPHDDVDEVTGGVGTVGDDELIVRAGGYYPVSHEDFIGIEEKQAF